MKKFIIYLVTIALTVLFILHSFYRASEVGLVLRETHPWLEIAYYVVLIINFCRYGENKENASHGGLTFCHIPSGHYLTANL